MMMTVSYDISSDRARLRVFKLLKKYGVNVQKSVFECDLNERSMRELKRRCLAEIDTLTDSVRMYPLCASCRGKIDILGTGTVKEEKSFFIA